MNHMRRLGGFGPFLLFALLTALGASELQAQNTTGVIRGRVLNESGEGVGGADVRIANPETGAVRRTISNETGAYALAGVQPATYELTVEMIGYGADPRMVRVLIGQTLHMDIVLAPRAVRLEGITAVSERAVETRTPEVATNVTEEQMRSLPQPT